MTFLMAPPRNPFFFSFDAVVELEGGRDEPEGEVERARRCSSAAAPPIFSMTFFMTLEETGKRRGGLGEGSERKRRREAKAGRGGADLRCVLARVHACERCSRVREGLHSDGLVSVVGGNVLEGLDGGEGGLVLWASQQRKREGSDASRRAKGRGRQTSSYPRSQTRGVW